jgi:hypothetical protein
MTTPKTIFSRHYVTSATKPSRFSSVSTLKSFCFRSKKIWRKRAEWVSNLRLSRLWLPEVHGYCHVGCEDLICRYVAAQRRNPVSPFINLVVCLTTGLKPLPKRALHIVRSRASSFKWEYPLLSLRSSIGFLHLLHGLLVTSIPPFIFHSITRCRRQVLRKMWPIQLAFRLLISCTISICEKFLKMEAERCSELLFSIEVHLSHLFMKNLFVIYKLFKTKGRCMRRTESHG